MAAIPPAAVADEDEEEDFENQDRTDPLDELLAASSTTAGLSPAVAVDMDGTTAAGTGAGATGALYVSVFCHSD